eukprot:g5789.t1
MQTAIITGGNTGIGFETAAALANEGFRTIIACRDGSKAEAAVESLKSRVPGGKIESRLVDLADMSSIHEFAKTIAKDTSSIDVLINNAGIMACPQMKTKDGLEMQMGVNHLGHFLLTSLLYPMMKSHTHQARIVNVSSMAHKYGGKVNFDDINNENKYSKYKQYGQSKLANVMFTKEMARRVPKEDNVSVNCCHPGIVATELQRHLVPENPNFFLKPFVSMMNCMIKTPAQGAATSIYLATSPDVKETTSKYFVNCKEASVSKLAKNEEDCKKLWELSNSITKAKWDF